jgi:hypothetical protein
MPVKKSSKPASKTVSPVPKYRLGQKVYFIVRHKGKPEECIEGEIARVYTREYYIADGLGNRTGKGHSFSYDLRTRLMPIDANQEELYPSFAAASHAYTPSLSNLIKVNNI